MGVLVLNRNNTRTVIPAVLKRESSDGPGYQLSRVGQFTQEDFCN